MRTLLLAALGCLLVAGTAHARDASGAYKVRGLGWDLCMTYMETPQGSRELYFSWLAGYLTSYNYLVRDTYSIAEHSGIARTANWFDDYCTSHPEQPFHEAARAFVTERYRGRRKYKTPPEAENGDNARTTTSDRFDP